MKRKALYIVVLFLFASCDTDFLSLDEIGPYTNKLVVNGVVESGQNVSIELSHSTSTVSADLPQAVTTADVRFTQNGTSHLATYNAGTKRYNASFTPQAGDLITLSVNETGYLPVSAVVQIPASIQSTGTLTPNGGVDTSGIPSDLLSVQFQDVPDEHNYYKINFFYYNTTLGQFIPMAFALNDPDISEYNSIQLNDASLMFSDELFDGESKTLSTVAPFGLVSGNPGDKYLIVLESVTEDLYRYYLTLQNAKDAREISFNNPFNNAVVIHTNISRGLGILGGSYVSRDTLR